MKITIWDILSIIAILALFIVGALVLQIFANPYSSLNPFPPPTMPAAIVLPSNTPTLRSMPATWTPTPGPGKAQDVQVTLTLTGTQPTLSTEFVVASFTPTPTQTGTPTITNTPTVYTIPGSGGTTSTKGPTATKGPSPTATLMANVKSAREKSGTTNDKWQKTNGNPTFLWDVSSSMFEYYWYFGRNPEGTSSNHLPIRHDSKTVELTPGNYDSGKITECGAYYLRIKTGYAYKQGNTLVSTYSGWNTVFTFKYDNTPANPPLFAAIGINGALRGIQNISGSPSFDWSGVNGANEATNMLLPVGDYIAYDLNSDGKKEAYMCSGTKGYNVYWGPDPNGVDYTRFTSSPKFKPSGVKANTSYFLRAQAVDNLDNRSIWWTVALDEEYDPEAVSFDPPTVDQAVFYYDTVKPNNLSGITETAIGYPNDGPFVSFTEPVFTFSGGQDPVGFNTSMIYGFDIVWGTSPDAKATFFRNNPTNPNLYKPTVTVSGTYYLRVRAVDWAGNRSLDWTQFVYRLDNVGPTGKPTLTELTGAPNNVFQNSFNDVSFTWDAAAIKDPGDAKSSSGLVPGYWIYWGPEADGVPSINQMGTSFDPPAVSTGVYYFRIGVRDNAGNETITTPFVLKYDDVLPANGNIIEVGGADNGIAQKPVRDPNFIWSGASDTGSGLAGFFVYWGPDPGGESTKFVTSAAYNPSAVSAGTYFLRIRAKDNSGNLAPDWTTFVFIYDPSLP